MSDPGIRFTLTVDGEEQISRGLSRLGSAVKDVRPWLQTVENILESSVMKNFASQGGQVGGWAPLNARYAARKIAQVGSKPILELSGGLKKSFRRRKIGPLELKWGSDSRYGPLHQRGTRHMPARKIVELDANEKRTALKELQKFLIAARGK